MMETEQNTGAFDVWNLAKSLQKKEAQSGAAERTLIILGDRTSGIQVIMKANPLLSRY